MSDKDDVVKGKENNSPEQEKRKNAPDKDMDPEREVEKRKTPPEEKNPDDFE